MIKQNKYIMLDFDGKWAKNSLLLTAASIFLLMVYYFGIINMAEIGFLQVVFGAFLPLLLSIGYFVFLYILKWNAPGIFGMAGAVICALLAVSSLFTGDVLRIIFAFACYAIAAGTLLLYVSGRLRNTSFCVAVFVIPAVLRIVPFGLGRIGSAEMFLDGSAVCLLAALACIPMMVRYNRKRA